MIGKTYFVKLGRTIAGKNKAEIEAVEIFRYRLSRILVTESNLPFFLTMIENEISAINRTYPRCADLVTGTWNVNDKDFHLNVGELLQLDFYLVRSEFLK